jgi:hypothetical protein
MTRFLRSSSALLVCMGLLQGGLQAQTVSLEANTDRMGGGDYKSIVMEPGDKPATCQAACANDKACKAYSYVKAGIKGPKAVCFLKSSVVPATPDTCCTSGAKGTPKIATPTPAPGGDVFSIEPGTDRLGADYKGFALDKPSVSVCQQACAQDPVCRAFSYVKAGVKGPRPMCFLKSSIAPATPNSCCTSGAKGYGPAAKIKVPKSDAEPVFAVPLYHFYEKKKDFFHFYTADEAEMKALKQQPTWEYVGITAYVMPKHVPDTVPLYRLVKPEFGGTNHFYTVDMAEANSFTNAGWNAENVAGYIAPKKLPNTVPLYRLYLDCQVPQDGKFRQPCEDAIGGDVHYYTADEVEKNKAVYNGMKIVRVEGYVWKTFVAVTP